MLQPKVAKKYQIVNDPPSMRWHTRFGQVDLEKIDLTMAEKLVKSGFKYLALVEKKAEKKAKEKAEAEENNS